MYVPVPGISVLQGLLNICRVYAAEHEITFDCNITIGVRFLLKSVNNLFHKLFYWMVSSYNFLTKWNTLVCG